MRGGGETCYLLGVALAFVALLACTGIHVLDWFDVGTNNNGTIFLHKEIATWDLYKLDVVISPWMFYVWMIMYFLQIFWLIYGGVAVCRVTKGGGSLVTKPPLVNSGMYYTFILGLASIIGWLVMWDLRGDFLQYSVLSIMAATVFFSFTVGLSIHSLNLHEIEAYQKGFGGDVTGIQILQHNCVGAFCAWTSMVTFYSIAAVLHTSNTVNKEWAQYIFMGLAMAYFLIWILLDVLWACRTTSTIVLPYVVIFFSFVMVFANTFTRRHHEKRILFDISAAFASASLFLIFIKLVIAMARCCMAPDPLIREDEFGAVEYQESEPSEHSPNFHFDAGSAGGGDGNMSFAEEPLTDMEIPHPNRYSNEVRGFDNNRY